MFDDILEETGFEEIESFEELQEAVNRRIEDYNKTPQGELGGLTPEQVNALLFPDWPSPSSPVKINDSLPEELASQVRIVKNSRIFLETAREKGGLPSTRAGNLKRKVVDDFLDRMEFDPDRLEFTRDYHKVINEGQFPPLHVLRVVLEAGGLVDKSEGGFHETSLAKRLLKPGRAGKFMKYLFLTYFQESDLFYSAINKDGENWEEFQETLPYALYRLSKFDQEWRPVKTFADRMLLPSIHELAEDRGEDILALTYSARVLSPLAKFDLVEGRGLGMKGIEDFNPEYRKTPLFDRFIEFDLNLG